MNIKQKLALSSASFLVGIFILLISLVKTSAVRALSQAEIETSRKQFYLGEELKPDHVLYPVKVAQEKINLFMLTPEERVDKKIEYANQRMLFVQGLIDQQDYEIALATLIKSQQYLFEAAGFVEEASFSHCSLEKLVLTLEDHMQTVADLEQTFPENFSNQLNQLQRNQQAVLEKLVSIL